LRERERERKREEEALESVMRKERKRRSSVLREI